MKASPSTNRDPAHDRCRVCRFWQLDLKPAEVDEGETYNPGFGWCRRRPPQIIDHIARMAIQQPGFGGNNVDREDVASASCVQNATLYPATFGTDWCGEFARSHSGIPI